GSRRRAVGAALTRCLISHGQARGATVMVMEVPEETRQVITMITDHWQVTHRDQSGAYLTIHAQLPQPAEREWPEPRGPRLPGAELGRAEEERRSEQLAGAR